MHVLVCNRSAFNAELYAPESAEKGAAAAAANKSLFCQLADYLALQTPVVKNNFFLSPLGATIPIGHITPSTTFIAPSRGLKITFLT